VGIGPLCGRTHPRAPKSCRSAIQRKDSANSVVNCGVSLGHIVDFGRYANNDVPQTKLCIAPIGAIVPNAIGCPY